MNWLFSLYVAVLFFILTPAILLRIPKNGNKYTVAGVHALVFALLLHFTGKFVWNISMSMEGFSEGLNADTVSKLQEKAKSGCATAGGTWDPSKGCAIPSGATPAVRSAVTTAAQGAQSKAQTQCTKTSTTGGWCDDPAGCQFDAKGCYVKGATTTAGNPPRTITANGTQIANSAEMQAWGFNN